MASDYEQQHVNKTLTDTRLDASMFTHEVRRSRGLERHSTTWRRAAVATRGARGGGATEDQLQHGGRRDAAVHSDHCRWRECSCSRGSTSHPSAAKSSWVVERLQTLTSICWRGDDVTHKPQSTRALLAAVVQLAIRPVARGRARASRSSGPSHRGAAAAVTSWPPNPDGMTRRYEAGPGTVSQSHTVWRLPRPAKQRARSGDNTRSGAVGTSPRDPTKPAGTYRRRGG